MVGSRVEGFENMVNLAAENQIAIFEGDEYLSSCLDPRPKFHLYKPQIALISGIAWDHINVFPTHENYVEQFRIFIQHISAGECLIFCAEDVLLNSIVENSNPHIRKRPYVTPEYYIKEGSTVLKYRSKEYRMQVFGRHNMQNIMGAKLVCNELGLQDEDFLEAVMSFRGAGKRLQLLGQKSGTTIYLDFAHSPSKVEATVNAVKEQFPGRKLVACLELHTYSSLNKKFLSHYSHTMDAADVALVFFNPLTIEHKRLEMISADEVKHAFITTDLQVITSKADMESFLDRMDLENSVLLLMSSGNFAGIDFKATAERILSKIK